MSEPRDVSSLTSEIYKAFSNTPMPQEQEILCDNESVFEVSEITTAFRNKSWRDIVPVFSTPPFNWALSSLCPEAFRYYLPGYMIALLGAPDEDSELLYIVVTLLTPALNQSFFDFVKELTTEQKYVVGLFLKWVGELDEGFLAAEVASSIGRHWGARHYREYSEGQETE